MVSKDKPRMSESTNQGFLKGEILGSAALNIALVLMWASEAGVARPRCACLVFGRTTNTKECEGVGTAGLWRGLLGTHRFRWHNRRKGEIRTHRTSKSSTRYSRRRYGPAAAKYELLQLWL